MKLPNQTCLVNLIYWGCEVKIFLCLKCFDFRVQKHNKTFYQKVYFILKYGFVQYLSNGTMGTSTAHMKADLHQLPCNVVFGRVWALTNIWQFIYRRKLQSLPKIILHGITVKLLYFSLQQKYKCSQCAIWKRMTIGICSSKMHFLVMLFGCQYSHFPFFPDLFETVNHLILVTNKGIKRKFGWAPL